MTKAGKGILRGAQDALDYVLNRTDDIKADTLKSMRDLENGEGAHFKNKNDFFKDLGL